MNQYGYRVVQKCLEVSKKESQLHYTFFMKAINENEERCEKFETDQYGNYVIQKCLEVFELEDLNRLITILNKNVKFSYLLLLFH